MSFTAMCFLAILCLNACISKDDVNALKKDIADLRAEKSQIDQEISDRGNTINNQKDILDSLKQEIASKGLDKKIAEGEKIKFILVLELRQTHFSLSISKHIKDAMNAVTFEMAVDRDLYDHVNVGSELLDSFRGGSFLLHGSAGSWKVTVKDKKIINTGE